ncbi:MAG: chromate resistance protein [Dehalococcoidia bacterium]|nr:chromate resistance protein [Dehalococcoidia bacterium]
MKWVTRENAKVGRVACPWLITRFIDPQAEFLFVPREEILDAARREGAHSFDAKGAEFGHRGRKCTFETLIEAHHLHDPALERLAVIVHGADVPEDIGIAPEAAGLLAVSEGMAKVSPNDHRKLQFLFPVYDALYAWCQEAS